MKSHKITIKYDLLQSYVFIYIYNTTRPQKNIPLNHHEITMKLGSRSISRYGHRLGIAAIRKPLESLQDVLGVSTSGQKSVFSGEHLVIWR